MYKKRIRHKNSEPGWLTKLCSRDLAIAASSVHHAVQRMPRHRAGNVTTVTQPG